MGGKVKNTKFKRETRTYKVVEFETGKLQQTKIQTFCSIVNSRTDMSLTGAYVDEKIPSCVIDTLLALANYDFIEKEK